MSRAKKPRDCILQDYLCLWWGQSTVSSCEWLKKTVICNASPNKLQYHVTFQACNRHLLLNIKKQGERYACVLSHFSHVKLFTTLWTVAHQAPLSMGFSRQENWSGLPCPPPGDLPQPGIKHMSPALQVESLLLSTGEALEKDILILLIENHFPLTIPLGNVQQYSGARYLACQGHPHSSVYLHPFTWATSNRTDTPYHSSSFLGSCHLFIWSTSLTFFLSHLQFQLSFKILHFLWHLP